MLRAITTRIRDFHTFIISSPENIEFLCVLLGKDTKPAGLTRFQAACRFNIFGFGYEVKKNQRAFLKRWFLPLKEKMDS